MSWREAITGAGRVAFNTFGTALRYTPAGSSSPATTTPAGSPLLGVFASSSSVPDPNAGGMKVVSEKPAVTVHRADLPTDAAALTKRSGDTVELVGDNNAPPEFVGVEFVVEEVHVDAMGKMRLTLARAGDA